MNLKSLWLRTQVGGKRVKGKEEGEGQMKAEEKGVGGEGGSGKVSARFSSRWG